LTTFSFHGLDGPASVSSIETDYIFPFLASMVMVMIAFTAERFLHAWHEDPKSVVNLPVQVSVHDSLQSWEELKGMDSIETSEEVQVQTNPLKLLHVAVFLSVPMVALVSVAWGLLVGAAWTVAPGVGLMVSVWVFVTQLLVLIGTTFVLIAGKVSVKNAVLLTFLPAIVFHLLGGIIGTAVGPTATGAARYLAAIASGLVVYVGIAQIGPWLVRQIGHKRVLGQTVVIFGAFVALFILGYYLVLPTCQ
jgi:hypothetical protein